MLIRAATPPQRNIFAAAAAAMLRRRCRHFMPPIFRGGRQPLLIHYCAATPALRIGYCCHATALRHVAIFSSLLQRSRFSAGHCHA